MSTRGYCAATTAAPVTTVASGTWTFASEEVQRAWLLAVDTAQTLANGTSIGPWTAGNKASDRRFVSPPLNGAQTIAGTFKAYARAAETLALGNITTQMEVYVVSNDGQTVRGTLLSIGHYGSGAELNLTTKRNAAFALAGTTLSSVNAQDRDRVVVVFGYTDSGGVTPEAQATWGSSQANAIDFPEDETTTTSRNPWFEFSQDLVFDLEPTWVGDPHQAPTVTLNGSDVSSLAKFDGSLSATFDQATANLQPTSQAGFGRTQMDFDDTFGSKDFLATATTIASFLPNRGHWTIIVEFASDNQGAAGGANGRIGPVGASASGCLWCNIYPGTGAALRLSAGMLDTSFASHQANDTVDVATGVRVVGTFAGRGQMISTQTDANTPTTFTAAATVGITWDTAHLFSIGATSPNVGSGFNLNGQISRVAIFPRYLNAAEAAIARAQWFTDKYAETESLPPPPMAVPVAAPALSADDDLPVSGAAPTIVEDDGISVALGPRAAAQIVQAIGEDDAPAGALFGVPHEDYAATLTVPPAAAPWSVAPASVPVWRDGDQEPAGALFGVPIEDHPAHLTLPPAASWPASSRSAVEAWRHDEQEPAGSMFGVPTEDLPPPLALPPSAISWSSAPTAVPVWRHDEQEPAGSMFGVPSDDAWDVVRPRPTPSLVTALVDEGEEPVTPAATIAEEDAWSVARGRPATAPPAVVADDDFAPAPAATIAADDDFTLPSTWSARPPAPVSAADDDLPCLFGDDEGAPVFRTWARPSPVGALVEDEVVVAFLDDSDPSEAPPPRSWPSAVSVRAREDDDVLVSLAEIAEDVRLLSVAPWGARLVLAFLDDDVALPNSPPIDDDRFGPPAPWPRILPVVALADDDLPAGSLIPEERELDTVRPRARRWLVVALGRTWSVTPREPTRVVLGVERTLTVRPRARTLTLTAEHGVVLRFSAKDPDEILDYAIDFVNLLAAGESITDATSEIFFVKGDASAALPVVVGSADFSDDPIVSQRISGGDTGATHRVEIEVTTTAGRKVVSAALIEVKDGAGDAG